MILNFLINRQNMHLQVQVYKNLLYKEVNEIIYGLEYVLKDCQMFVAAILSHGREGIFHTREGKEFKIERFLEKFNNYNCQELLGVPKFFIFQACRYASPDLFPEAL